MGMVGIGGNGDEEGALGHAKLRAQQGAHLLRGGIENGGRRGRKAATQQDSRRRGHCGVKGLVRQRLYKRSVRIMQSKVPPCWPRCPRDPHQPCPASGEGPAQAICSSSLPLVNVGGAAHHSSVFSFFLPLARLSRAGSLRQQGARIPHTAAVRVHSVDNGALPATWEPGLLNQ